MLKQKAVFVARIVYGVDLALTSLAFFTAFFIRDLILPTLDPQHFPTGLFPLAEYLKIYPLVLIIWSVLNGQNLFILLMIIGFSLWLIC